MICSKIPGIYLSFDCLKLQIVLFWNVYNCSLQYRMCKILQMTKNTKIKQRTIIDILMKYIIIFTNLQSTSLILIFLQVSVCKPQTLWYVIWGCVLFFLYLLTETSFFMQLLCQKKSINNTTCSNKFNLLKQQHNCFNC